MGLLDQFDTRVIVVGPSAAQDPYPDPVELLRDMRADVVRCEDPALALAHVRLGENILFVLDPRDSGPVDWAWASVLAQTSFGPVLVLVLDRDEKTVQEAEYAGVFDCLELARIAASPLLLASCARHALAYHRLSESRSEVLRRLEIVERELASRNRELTTTLDRSEQALRDAIHQFRSPLSTARQFASLLCEGASGPVSERQRDFLGFILDASEELADRFEDYHDASLVRWCRAPNRPQAWPVIGLFDAAIDEVGGRFSEGQVQLNVRLDRSLSPVVVDRVQLVQAIAALLRNALRMSAPGGEVTLWAKDAAEEFVEIGCAAQAPGPEPEDLILFQRDTIREDGTTRSSAREFGLDLELAKVLARSNKGWAKLARPAEGGSACLLWVPTLTRANELDSPRAGRRLTRADS